MEKNTTAVLKDFTARIESLEQQLAALKEELASLAAAPAPEEPAESPAEPVDIDFDVLDIPETAVPEAPAVEVEIPQPEEEPVPAEECLNGPGDEDMPLFAEEAPAPAPVKEKKAPAKDAHYAWMTARPGMPVKNVRSAISLFDRALFINTLFKEDYALYEKTIAEVNNLSTLDEAVDYVAAHFPDWNLNSDVVYSFMMAIRKKLG